MTSLQPVPLSDEISASDAPSLVSQLRGLRFSQQTKPTNLTDPDARLLVWLYTAIEVRGIDTDLVVRRQIWLDTTPGVNGRKSL